MFLLIGQDVSPSLKRALNQLQNQCFLIKEAQMSRQELTLMKRSTPMTYYYIVQSLLERYAWVDSAAQLISQPVVSAPFQLAWRTQQQWLAGKEVLQFFSTCQYSDIKNYSMGNPPLRYFFTGFYF